MTKTEIKYLLLIITIFIAACIETDIYLPAFPDMMIFFSTSEEAIQSLLTWNFIGICISGPFYGPISDAYGRKKPLNVALLLFLLGSIITLLADDFTMMLSGRVLQGLGSGGCFTLGTAIIFDSFQKDRAIAAVNQLNTIIPVIMAGAPLIGGYLNNTFGFRSNFVFIAIFVFISFLVCLLFYKETLAPEKRIPLNKENLVSDFKRVLLCRPFWELTLVMSLLFGGYLAFVSSTAVLFVLEMGVPKHLFPFYQAAILGSYVLASLTCSRAITRWGLKSVKRIGIITITMGGFGLTIISLIADKNPFLLNGVMMFYAFGCSWLMGPYFGECMELLPKIKGIAASLITSVRLLITALIVGINSMFYNSTISPTVILLALITITVLPLVFHYERNVDYIES